VYAEIPFTGGVSPNAPKSTAFTLTTNSSQNGKVLGGAREMALTFDPEPIRDSVGFLIFRGKPVLAYNGSSNVQSK
jgi:hypothetical protein